MQCVFLHALGERGGGVCNFTPTLYRGYFHWNLNSNGVDYLLLSRKRRTRILSHSVWRTAEQLHLNHPFISQILWLFFFCPLSSCYTFLFFSFHFLFGPFLTPFSRGCSRKTGVVKKHQQLCSRIPTQEKCKTFWTQTNRDSSSEVEITGLKHRRE